MLRFWGFRLAFRPTISGVIRTASPLVVALAMLGAPTEAAALDPVPVRGAYFYNYMALDHLDSLARAGMNRAIIKWIGDSIGAGREGAVRAWHGRGVRVGIEVAPCWAFLSDARLTTLHTARRYTWTGGSSGKGKDKAKRNVEAQVACPLDSAYWRSALLDRANEFLSADTSVRRLVVDPELYRGSRHHYDAGPCWCDACLREAGPKVAGDPAALESVQEARLTRVLAALLTEFATAHPGVEIGCFDLDFNSFSQRALGRALVTSHVPTADYTEATYTRGAAAMPEVRARLARAGVTCPVYGGLWLKRFKPDSLALAINSSQARGDGYYLFTTFSLAREPEKLTGPYVLQGSQADYWSALRRANGRR